MRTPDQSTTQSCLRTQVEVKLFTALNVALNECHQDLVMMCKMIVAAGGKEGASEFTDVELRFKSDMLMDWLFNEHCIIIVNAL